MLRHGAELGGAAPEEEALATAIEARLRTGRPLGSKQWLARHEAALGRPLALRKRGPKPKTASN